MQLVEQFEKNLNGLSLFSKSDRLLIAISGGLDSMVLAKLAMLAGYQIKLAHCNFKLRGEESERDEKFVREFASTNKLELFVNSFDTAAYADAEKLSIQEAARKLRYDWFNKLIGEGKADYILTAHHADDNVETVAMNFFRGTGLHGLTGIPAKNGLVRRPLLSIFKEELLAFAETKGLKFIEDSSNESEKYTRNFFRLTILPLIEKVYPAAKENLLANISRFSAVEALHSELVSDKLKNIIVFKGEDQQIPMLHLQRNINNSLLYEWVSPYGFTEAQLSEIHKLYSADSGKFIVSASGEYRLLKHRNWMILGKVAGVATTSVPIEKDQFEVDFSLGKLSLTSLTKAVDFKTLSASEAQIDAGKLEFPLMFRPWRLGDYFYPLGLAKKKKLSRFFIDNKLSLAQKEKIWVLESNGKIVWIVGQRIDDRFKLTPKTKSILKLSVASKA
jgi:tRNA(Ile)-lysidine synthase